MQLSQKQNFKNLLITKIIVNLNKNHILFFKYFLQVIIINFIFY